MPIERSKKQNSLTYQVCLNKEKDGDLIQFLEDQREENRISNSKLFLKSLRYFKGQYDFENFNDEQKKFKLDL